MTSAFFLILFFPFSLIILFSLIVPSPCSSLFLSHNQYIMFHITIETSSFSLILTFSICTSKQCFVASVQVLFTSLIFLLVCASFLCMLSIRLWFLVSLVERKRFISMRIASCVSIFSTVLWRRNSLNHSLEKFHFALYFLDFQINTMLHRLFTAVHFVLLKMCIIN